MHAVQKSGIGKIAQISADGLQGHIEPLGQVFDLHPAFGTGDFKDLALSQIQGQGLIRLLCAMITPECPPGNAARRHVPACIRGENAKYVQT